MRLSRKAIAFGQSVKRTQGLLSSSPIVFVSLIVGNVYSLLALLLPFAKGEIPGEMHAMIFFTLFAFTLFASAYVYPMLPGKDQYKQAITSYGHVGRKYGLAVIVCASYVHLSHRLAVLADYEAMAESFDQYTVLVKTLVLPIEFLILPLLGTFTVLIAVIAVSHVLIVSYNTETTDFRDHYQETPS
jgi:hypothetical protein